MLSHFFLCCLFDLECPFFDRGHDPKNVGGCVPSQPLEEPDHRLTHSLRFAESTASPRGRGAQPAGAERSA